LEYIVVAQNFLIDVHRVLCNTVLAEICISNLHRIPSYIKQAENFVNNL